MNRIAHPVRKSGSPDVEVATNRAMRDHARYAVRLAGLTLLVLSLGNAAAADAFGVRPAPQVATEPAPPPSATEPAKDEPPPKTQPATPPASPTPAVDRRVADLELKIAQLESGLGKGRGAYKGGASLRVDGGSESLLERVRRLESEGEAARTAISGKDRVISELRQQLATTAARGDRLNERVDVLKHAHDSLETAQQELAERTRTITSLQEQLATSELLRLRAERLYYLLSAQLIRLQPTETQELRDLQHHVRLQVQELKANSSGAAP